MNGPETLADRADVGEPWWMSLIAALCVPLVAVVGVILWG